MSLLIKEVKYGSLRKMGSSRRMTEASFRENVTKFVL